MNIKENFEQNYDKYSFGEYVKKRRIELGISLRELAKNIGISAPSLLEIEKGLKHAPTKIIDGRNRMQDLIRYLKIEEDEIYDFYEMADTTRTNYPDIDLYLSQNKLAKTAIRLAKDIDLSDDEWQAFISHLHDIKSNKQIK